MTSERVMMKWSLKAQQNNNRVNELSVLFELGKICENLNQKEMETLKAAQLEVSKKS